MSSEIQLREFNLRAIKQGMVVGIIGRRGSGKTTLVQDILYHLRRIPTATLFGGVYDLGEHFPATFVIPTYDEIVMSSILARSKKTLEPTLIVIDDCIHNKKSFSRDPSFNEILMNGRHFNITLIITMQHPIGLIPEQRSQFDKVFAFKDNILTNVEKLWRHYFGVVTYNEFRDIMNACCIDRNCLVLDNTSQSNDPAKLLFYYKAVLHNPFRVGSRSYWYFDAIRGRKQEPDIPLIANKRKLITLSNRSNRKK